MGSATSTYLFAGDGLTEGIYGESYVERFAEALHRGQHGGGACRVLNAGRGGDTVRALLDRVDGLLEQYQPQWAILAVGGSDVWLPWLSSRSLGWWLWLQVRRIQYGQRPTTDLDQFAAAYRRLIRSVREARANALACTISPLGEQLTWPPNRQLARLNGVIKQVAVENLVPVADVWQAFVDGLALVSNPSRYVPGEWLAVWLDRYRLRTTSPDELSRRRHLHLTCDGIHLNSRGADLWAATILSALIQAGASPIAGDSLPPLARLVGPGSDWLAPPPEG